MPPEFGPIVLGEAEAIIKEVGARIDPKDLVGRVAADLRALAVGAESGPTASAEGIVLRVREVLLKAAYATRPYCLRCGKCCVAGSPTLLHEDRRLFTDGALKPEHIMTIRAGEPAYFNVTGEAGHAAVEMLKVREVSGTRTCIFFEPPGSCGIHDFRPAQCRFQECWNPAKAEAKSHLPRLTRRDLLYDSEEFWRIIERHEERCSFEAFTAAIARLQATKGQTVTELLELLRFDQHVRTFVMDKLQIAPDAMVFFFGRPLSECIRAYGLKVEALTDGSFLLTTIESAGPGD